MLYLSQLLGAPVEDLQGERIGKIIDVEETRSISSLSASASAAISASNTASLPILVIEGPSEHTWYVPVEDVEWHEDILRLRVPTQHLSTQPVTSTAGDPLIVAIGGAAAVRDLAKRAGRRPQGHHRGIDIAGLADRRIDQHAGGGEQLDRFLAHEPARHVEIVDHHVAEQPAGEAHIAERRRCRIAAGYAQEFEPADAAGAQLIGQPRKVRIEAAIEPDHQRDAAALGHRNARSGASLFEIERFFAEDRLAGTGCRLDQLGMGVGRAGDDDRVDGRIGQCCLERGNDHAMAVREALCRVAIDIDNRRQPRLGMAGDVRGMDRADPPGAELAEIDHGHRLPTSARAPYRSAPAVGRCVKMQVSAEGRAAR